MREIPPTKKLQTLLENELFLLSRAFRYQTLLTLMMLESCQATCYSAHSLKGSTFQTAEPAQSCRHKAENNNKTD